VRPPLQVEHHKSDPNGGLVGQRNASWKFAGKINLIYTCSYYMQYAIMVPLYGYYLMRNSWELSLSILCSCREFSIPIPIPIHFRCRWDRSYTWCGSGGSCDVL